MYVRHKNRSASASKAADVVLQCLHYLEVGVNLTTTYNTAC